MSNLNSLPRLDATAYGFRSEQGEPAEKLINSLLGAKHWSEFEGTTLAETITDEVPLLSDCAFARLLPALIQSANAVVRGRIGELWHFIESVESSMSARIQDNSGTFVKIVRAEYDERQFEELNDLWGSLSRLLSEAGLGEEAEDLAATGMKLKSIM